MSRKKERASEERRNISVAVSGKHFSTYCEVAKLSKEQQQSISEVLWSLVRRGLKK